MHFVKVSFKQFILFSTATPILFLLACQSTKDLPQQGDYLQLSNERVTGDLAYETTAYVEQYWRQVGNRGFDSSIYFIENKLKQYGYVSEEDADENAALTYRIEKRALKNPTWEPVNAELRFANDSTSLLQFASNRNMLAINSYSTPEEGVKAEVVKVSNVANASGKELEGKIVFGEMNPYYLYKLAKENGAIGILSYDMPAYLQPEKNKTSIQFRGIPRDEKEQLWAMPLSYEAKEKINAALEEGTVTLHAMVETKLYESEELTIVADVKGQKHPQKRMVFSAHVQEPGANDNATGVGVQLEMAKTIAEMVQEDDVAHNRTLTFLWGDEITSTQRYVMEDDARKKDIKWGMSLDMVGENTAKTGGVFLIEKMPDPSAIWTRGADKHTEWGAGEVTLDDMVPHYLNDLLVDNFNTLGEMNNWKVSCNPFEGGSDHVPFLKADIPGALLWHFTDQFYHTDNDRLDKVSQTTLKNVGSGALAVALILINADEQTAFQVLELLQKSAETRLLTEIKLSKEAIASGADVEEQREIISAWKDYYEKAFETVQELSEEKASADLQQQIKEAQQSLDALVTEKGI